MPIIAYNFQHCDLFGRSHLCSLFYRHCHIVSNSKCDAMDAFIQIVRYNTRCRWLNSTYKCSWRKCKCLSHIMRILNWHSCFTSQQLPSYFNVNWTDFIFYCIFYVFFVWLFCLCFSFVVSFSISLLWPSGSLSTNIANFYNNTAHLRCSYLHVSFTKPEIKTNSMLIGQKLYETAARQLSIGREKAPFQMNRFMVLVAAIVSFCCCRVLCASQSPLLSSFIATLKQEIHIKNRLFSIIRCYQWIIIDRRHRVHVCWYSNVSTLTTLHRWIMRAQLKLRELKSLEEKTSRRWETIKEMAIRWIGEGGFDRLNRDHISTNSIRLMQLKSSRSFSVMSLSKYQEYDFVSLGSIYSVAVG